MKRSDFLQKTTLVALAGLAVPNLQLIANPYLYAASGEQEFAKHKIAEINFFNAEVKYPRNVGRNAIRGNHGTGSNVEACVIRTDQGAIAWGAMENNKEVYTRLAPPMIGKKVSELFSVNEGMLLAENKCFEIAFFDLAGIILNKPVYKLLGTEKPIANKCYSGMIYFDDLDPEEKPGGIDKLLEECAYDYKVGYRQFKLKIGRGNKWMEHQAGNQRDIDVTREIAKAFPDCEILVDANDGYNVDEFIRYLNSIGSPNLVWVEEPFQENVADCKKLRDWMKASHFSKVLYADGEYAPNYALMQELIDKQLIDVILYDILGYGFAKWRKMIPSLAGTKILASPHAWGSGIKTSYISHLCSAYGNTATIEGVTSISEIIDLSHFKLEKGMLIPPDLPGFGMKLLKNID